MASIPSWQTQPDIWNRLQLGDDQLPGPVKVTLAAPLKSGLDVRKAPKTSKAQLVDQGYELSRFRVTLTYGVDPVDNSWPSAADQISRWFGIVERIRPRKSQARNALSVSHPLCQLCGVSKVYVESLDPCIGEGPGSRTAVIELMEYDKIHPVSSGTVGGTAKPKGSTSLVALDAAPNPATNNSGP